MCVIEIYMCLLRRTNIMYIYMGAVRVFVLHICSRESESEVVYDDCDKLHERALVDERDHHERN